MAYRRVAKTGMPEDGAVIWEITMSCGKGYILTSPPDMGGVRLCGCGGWCSIITGQRGTLSRDTADSGRLVPTMPRGVPVDEPASVAPDPDQALG